MGQQWNPPTQPITSSSSSFGDWKPPSNPIDAFVGPEQEFKQVKIPTKENINRDTNESASLSMPSSKEPDTYWGGFGKGLKDYGKEQILSPSMLEGAANPKTAGDLLGLMIPAGGNISKLFGRGSKIPQEIPPISKSSTKPHIDAKSYAAMRDAKNEGLLQIGEMPKVEPLPVGDNEGISAYLRRNGVDSVDVTPEQAARNRATLPENQPITQPPNRRISQESTPPNGISERRQAELLDKFGGRQVENAPDALNAVDDIPGNSIPLAEPEVMTMPKVTGKSGNASSIMDRTPEADFNPESLFPHSDDIIDSKLKASKMKSDIQGMPRAGQRMNPPEMGRSSVFDTPTSSHGPDNSYHNGQSYDMRFASDAQDAASKSKARGFKKWAENKKANLKKEEGVLNISGIGSGPIDDLKNSRFGEAISDSIKEHGIPSTIGNTMKAGMSTGDMSAPLRQGAALIHKKEFREALPEMVKMFGDDAYYTNRMGAIKNDPLFKFADDMGLELTGLNAGKEERFLSTIMEEIPVYGKLVKASDRAYTGFLNDLRFSTYKSLLNDATKAGLTPGRNKDLAKEIASFVNDATGRGKLGEKGEKAAELLNALFYSPRLLSSRVRMIGRTAEAIVGPLRDKLAFVERVVNPKDYFKQSPFVRKEALKSAISLASFNLTINGLATAAGGKVVYDVKNSDFMKNRFGDTRVDFGAGFLQPIVFASRLITGKYSSSTSGKTSELSTDYGGTDNSDLIWRFITSKESPLIGAIAETWTGKDNFTGKDKNRAVSIAERFAPMLNGDLYDILKTNPEYAALIVPGIVGASVQTYSRTPRKMKGLSAPGMSMPSQ